MGNGYSGDPDYDDDELPTPRTRSVQKNFVVECPVGDDDMYAKIPRELGGAWKVTRGCREGHNVCDQCEADIDLQAARYCCNVHRATLCMACSREQLGLPEITSNLGNLASVDGGDILLCLGNVSLLIHHVILARGPLQIEPLNPRVRSWLEPEPGMQVLGLDTIEASTEHKGLETEWAFGTHYFIRNPHTGETRVVAHFVIEGEKFELYEHKEKFKLLMNPVRAELGGPGINKNLFFRQIMESAADSKPWQANAGLAAQVLLRSGIYEEKDYDTSEKRMKLLEKIRADREAGAGVCTSVPVIVWQDYFMQLHANDPDICAEMILQYMPLSAEKAVPSTLVQELTKRNWVVQENFEAGLLA